jgi:hypothetical protein
MLSPYWRQMRCGLPGSAFLGVTGWYPYSYPASGWCHAFLGFPLRPRSILAGMGAVIMPSLLPSPCKSRYSM